MSFLRKRKKRKRPAPEAKATTADKHPKKRKARNDLRDNETDL